ncbi:U-megalopygitoxin(8)-Mo12-like isoform X2 [Anticarsia gemmatalis]
MQFYFLLLLPVLITAKIEVQVIATEDDSQRQIHVSGSDVTVVGDNEIQTFNLYEGKLKEAVKNYYGKEPDDIFLKSPTPPLGDLYKKYGWKPVSRILKPISAKMLGVKYKPLLVLTKIFNNTSSNPMIIKEYARQNVENTIASTWNTKEELLTSLNISYGFDLIATSVSGTATITYTSNWGESVMKSEMVTVGSETALEMTLHPNQSAIVEIFATVGRMEVQIDYEASLDGFIAVNYENIYKNHHFSALDVNSVLLAGGMQRSLLSSEVITLGYYSESEIVFRDRNTNDILNYF